MSLIPPDTVTQADLAAWFELKKELDRVKAAEMLLRVKIFRAYFPDPKEGTNTAVLPDTYQLKGVHTINRKIVVESMQAMCAHPESAPGQFGPSMLERAGIRQDALIKWTPELANGVYRELTAEQQHLVDQMLLVSAGSPSLKVEPPSKKAVKA